MKLPGKEHGEKGEYEVSHTVYYPGYKEYVNSTVKP